jgi:hypothetical protein
MRALSERYQDGRYSDLEIACGDTSYHVHRVIVCSLSPFFAHVCSGSFQEAPLGVISLPNDDPTAVRLMMHYFYHLDYPYIPLSRGVHDLGATEILPFGVIRSDVEARDTVTPNWEKKKKKTKKTARIEKIREAKKRAAIFEPELESPEVEAEVGLEAVRETEPLAEPEFAVEVEAETIPELYHAVTPEAVEAPEPASWPESEPELGIQASVSEPKPEPPASFQSRETNLMLHARVYALAEKYEIGGLREVALSKFKVELDSNWDTRDFLEAIKIVYNSTPKSNRGMRDVVAATFHNHQLLTQPELREYIRDDTDLVYDLLVFGYRY